MPKSKYLADDGEIHFIRISPQVAAVANNDPPAGAVTSNIKVKVSKTNREFGLRPRFVRVAREVDVDTETRNLVIYRTIPVLTPTAFNSASFALNAVVSYEGDNYTVIQKEPEDY